MVADDLTRAYRKLEECKTKLSALTVDEEENYDAEELIEANLLRKAYLRKQQADLNELVIEHDMVQEDNSEVMSVRGDSMHESTYDGGNEYDDEPKDKKVESQKMSSKKRRMLADNDPSSTNPTDSGHEYATTQKSKKAKGHDEVEKELETQMSFFPGKYTCNQ